MLQLQTIFALVLILLPTAVTAEDWPTFQHDNQRTGFTAEQVVATDWTPSWEWTSPDTPQPAWAGPAKWDAYANIRNLPAMRNYDHAPHVIAAQDCVYFGSTTDDTVRCLDAKTGSERWRFTTDGPIRIAPT